MKLNEKIKKTLLNLFNQNFNLIKNSVVQELFDEYINENNENYLNLGIKNYLEDEEVINLNKVKQNGSIISAFEKAKNFEINDNVIIKELINDIKNSLFEVKEKVSFENKGFKNQIIFLEYDYLPQAYFCGFGIGNYPILKKPEYFEFNFKEELYAGIGIIDYTSIWGNLIEFNQLLEDLDIFDSLNETNLYQNLLNTYKFKTYLLLFEAFKRIGIEAFNGLEIEKPLYIYGNEHDCESINIYVFE